MESEGKKGKWKLTDRPKMPQDRKKNAATKSHLAADPRLAMIVRFLARRAAERDFAKAVDALKNDQSESKKVRGKP
jgi:hypothetical protein